MAHTFEYALIRLVPFAHRGEAFNVGMVVFKKNEIDVRLNPPARLVSYFNVSPRAIDWISTRIRQLDNAELGIDLRFAAIQKAVGYAISERGWFVTDSENQYEIRISDIMNEYVERPKVTKSKPPSSGVGKDLRKLFKEYGIYSQNIRDIEKHKIVPNMPVGPSGKLRVDFMLKNSCYHATETLDFSRSDHAGAAEIKNAALASVTFQHARDAYSNLDTRCYLVYSAPSMIEKAVLPALAIAQRETVDSFNLESREDKIRYLDIMLAAAGDRTLWNGGNA